VRPRDAAFLVGQRFERERDRSTVVAIPEDVIRLVDQEA
jgi:hypothetical protein